MWCFGGCIIVNVWFTFFRFIVKYVFAIVFVVMRVFFVVCFVKKMLLLNMFLLVIICIFFLLMLNVELMNVMCFFVCARVSFVFVVFRVFSRLYFKFSFFVLILFMMIWCFVGCLKCFFFLCIFIVLLYNNFMWCLRFVGVSSRSSFIVDIFIFEMFIVCVCVCFCNGGGVCMCVIGCCLFLFVCRLSVLRFDMSVLILLMLMCVWLRVMVCVFIVVMCVRMVLMCVLMSDVGLVVFGGFFLVDDIVGWLCCVLCGGVCGFWVVMVFCWLINLYDVCFLWDLCVIRVWWEGWDVFLFWICVWEVLMLGILFLVGALRRITSRLIWRTVLILMDVNDVCCINYM